jgi:hypothetical protein
MPQIAVLVFEIHRRKRAQIVDFAFNVLDPIVQGDFGFRQDLLRHIHQRLNMRREKLLRLNQNGFL